MKQFLLTCTAAISCAVGLSSFANPITSYQTLFYWQVKAGYGNYLNYQNDMIGTYYGTVNPGTSACAGTSTYRCVVGFSLGQVERVNGVTVLNTWWGFIYQTRVVTADKRPSL